MNAMPLSPNMTAVGGASPSPRNEGTGKLWAYIEKNNLQEGGIKRRVLSATIEPRSLTRAEIAKMVKSVKS